MLKFLQRRAPGPLYCRWLWHSITVLCDGTVTCGQDDPFKRRNYGNIAAVSLRTILKDAAIRKRRHALQAGIRCHGCSMYASAADLDAAALTPSEPFPDILILEPSIKCNIRCNNETCNIANDATIQLRHHNFMPWPLFCKLIDEVSAHIKELYFYNYGEPFLHPRALEMLAYVKRANPAIRITTSTNGILLAREGRAERIVAEGLVDWICFTIGGADQQTYARYHKAGSFEKAMLGMRRMMDAKRKLGRTEPIVHWRYLLFNWNDSDAAIEAALRLRDEIGVDEFRIMLTASPIEGRSLRRAPGTPGYAQIEPWLAYQEGYRADPFAEAGLWGAEYHPLLGHFSWTGTRARINVAPSSGHLNLRLARTQMLGKPMPAIKLRLPWAEVPAHAGQLYWRDNSMVVPDDFVEPVVPVEMEVSATFAPIRHRDSADNRELGVMLSMLNVAPTPNPYRLSAVSSGRVTDRSR